MFAETSNQMYLLNDSDPEAARINFPCHINDSSLGSGLKIKNGFSEFPRENLAVIER